jgi:hypothetical protein
MCSRASLHFRYHAIHDVQVQVLMHVHLTCADGCRIMKPPVHRAIEPPVRGYLPSSARRREQEVDLAHNGMQATRLGRAGWRKSRRSNPSGNCVEVAFLIAGQVAMRNSRHPDGPALVFTRADWDAFIGGARDGDFGRLPD